MRRYRSIDLGGRDMRVGAQPSARPRFPDAVGGTHRRLRASADNALGAAVGGHADARRSAGSLRDGDFSPDVPADGTRRKLLRRRDELSKLDALIDGFNRSAQAAASFSGRLVALGALARQLFDAMAFDFLFDPERELLSIGYRVADGSLDPSYYDLLASEARLASFVAIAKGDMPTRHWFRLGRALAPVGGGSALDLMVRVDVRISDALAGDARAGGKPARADEPPNRAPADEHTALSAACRGAFRNPPTTRATSNSPISIRALAFRIWVSSGGSATTPSSPLMRRRLRRWSIREQRRATSRVWPTVGGRGRYGWYEALDYTETRLPEGADVAVVRAYMAHHQGMSVIAIANALHDGAMRGRFHAEPIIQATELLLQERMPHDVAIFRASDRDGGSRCRRRRAAIVGAAPVHFAARPHAAHASALERPICGDDHRGGLGIQPLAGHRGHAMARGRHLRRLGQLRFPSRYAQRRCVVGGLSAKRGHEPDRYEVAFSEGRAEIIRHDGTITTTLEVAVSSEDDAEVRRVSITNLGSQIREIELTSYAEIVLAPHAADDAHPAFSKLFVETEFVADVGALLATRRRRSPGDAAGLGRASRRRRRRGRRRRAVRDRSGALSWPRTRTFGRRSPWSRRAPLSNTVGAVLDPIFSLRRRVRIPPRGDRTRRVLDADRPLARRSARSRRQASRRDGVRPRDHAGLDPGASAAAPPRDRRRATHTCSSASPIACSMPTRRCGRPPRRSNEAAARPRCCGRTGSPATCRSSWSASTKPPISRSSGNCSSRTNIGG